MVLLHFIYDKLRQLLKLILIVKLLIILHVVNLIIGVKLRVIKSQILILFLKILLALAVRLESFSIKENLTLQDEMFIILIHRN